MSDSPFGNFGFFNDIVKMIGQQGPDAWRQTARQLALSIVAQSGHDANPDPALRQRAEVLAPLVTSRLGLLLGVAAPLPPDIVSRVELAARALDDWEPLIAPSLNLGTPLDLTSSSSDTFAPMLAEIAKTMGPLFMGFQLGSAAGHFALSAWSRAVLPLPRQRDGATLCVDNVSDFAQSNEIDLDHVLAFAVAREVAGEVFLRRDGLSMALEALLLDAVNDARATQGNIMDRLTGMLSQGNAEDLMGDPSRMLEGLGAFDETPATQALDRAIAVIAAAIDVVAEQVTREMVGPIDALREAWLASMNREDSNESSAAALFGVSRDADTVQRARTFVESATLLEGADGLRGLFQADGLPSDLELDDATAWQERVANSPFAS